VLDVNDAGRGRVALEGAPPAGLADCVTERVRALRFTADAPAHLALNFAVDGEVLWLGTEPGNCPYPW
jgi:hypothetical protein